MKTKQERPFSMRESAKTLAFLNRAEQELRSKRRLARILVPVGTAIFLFNLLLASVNTLRFALGDELAKILDAMPLLPTLAAGLRGCFASWGGVFAALFWFVFLIPLAVCGAITLGMWLHERRNPKEEPPAPVLTGEETADARTLVERAETVYLLRCDFPETSVYWQAGILTVLLALPLLLGMIRIAGDGTGMVLQLTVLLFVLLLCLFGFYWICALLIYAFSGLLSLFCRVPGKQSFWELYNRLDVYWESVDPAEFSRRKHSAEREASERRSKWWNFGSKK